ncbi:hypothetical protein MHBO_002593 [Bonamia ostreae]|uniref:Uncharacterized protein n=1 Tax=Bonamia ostreae TaxID=126728 RepID=A0ABV2AMX7_9EUKA
MGNCVGKQNRVDKETLLINKQLEKDRLESILEIKILCLGAGESGKSTLLKQLKSIYCRNEDLPQKAKQRYRDILHANVKDTMAGILNICQKMSLDMSEVEEEMVLMLDADSGELLSPEEASAVSKLWENESVRMAFDNKTSHYIPDSAPYYFDNVERFSRVDFEPTEEDIIMSRVRTTGMIITDFNIPPLKYKVVDVGGQRSERKKWLRAFDDVQAILFVVNLAGYNTVLFEDETKNRLIESLELFEEIITNNYFSGIPIFIFFNKKDLFEKYLKKESIKCCFPDYDGSNKTQEQMEYIEAQFRNKIVGDYAVKGVNFIAARFKKDVKYAFEDIKKTLVEMNQKQIDKALHKK